MRKFIVVVLVLLPLTCFAGPRLRPSEWATPIINAHLRNFYQVDDQVYRSAQPDKNDIRDLRLFHIGEVLNLREFHSDDDNLPSTDFRLYHVEMRTGQITEDEIVAALRVIKNRKGPMLIHCWHGSDRTGVTMALYRIIFNGWSKQQALDEMINGGYGYHAQVYPELITLIENCDIDEIRRKLGE